MEFKAAKEVLVIKKSIQKKIKDDFLKEHPKEEGWHVMVFILLRINNLMLY